MKKFVFYIMAVLLSICFNFGDKAMACSVPDNLVPQQTFLKAVKNADMIVRATAVGSVGKNVSEQVKFKIVEIFKGEKVPETLMFIGHLTDTDNYNNQSAPYLSSRLSDKDTNCVAMGYKRGAEFLLILKKHNSKQIDPYWAAYAPTNEQLHPENDEWLNWIRNNLK